MTLAFRAKYVSCANAIGGEILQVCLDTLRQSEDKIERSTPYVLISRNFEFPESPTIEWHDGTDYDGGAEITSLTLRRDRASITLDRDLEIEVSFSLGARRFGELNTYLRRMLDEAVFLSHKSPNQQGRANGRQPFSSETNRTSGAAASRRSP